MTKQLKKNTLADFIIGLLGFLELAALTGAYAFHYFTKKKMGMLRHMVYLNGKWEAAYPLPAIKWSILTLLAILLILLIQKIRKKEEIIRLSPSKILALISSVLLCLASMSFIAFSSSKSNYAYYPISLLLTIATSLQAMGYLQSKICFKK